MKLSTLLSFLFIGQVIANEPIQRSNGIWYPGKGCGITTEIKYLSEVPEDESNLSCTFIQTNQFDLKNLKMNHECFKTGNPIEDRLMLAIPIEEAPTMEACMKICFNNKECQFIEYDSHYCYLQDQDLKTVTMIDYKNPQKYASKSCIIESWYEKP